jgi:hypothetical protein
MKSNSITVSAFLAAIAAVAFLPVSATAAGLALTTTGIMSVLVSDYGRNADPVLAAAPVLPFPSPGCAKAGLREAA